MKNYEFKMHLYDIKTGKCFSSSDSRDINKKGTGWENETDIKIRFDPLIDGIFHFKGRSDLCYITRCKDWIKHVEFYEIKED